MNKKEFLTKLEYLMKDMPEDERQDILYDYEEHFRIGMEEGKTEEEIAKSLGNPEVLVKEFINTESQESQHRSSIGGFLRGLLNFKSYEVDQREVVDATNLQAVDINSSSVSVRLCSNKEDDQVRINLVGNIETAGLTSNVNLPTLQVKKEEGTLLIEVKRKGSMAVIGTFMENVRLEIQLPVSIQDALVNTRSGSIKLEQIKLNNLKVDTASGSIKLDCSMVKRGLLDTASGSIKLSSTMGEIKAETLSGSIKLDSVKSDNATLSTASGSIKLENVTGNVFAKTASGSIKGKMTEIKGELSSLSGAIKGEDLSGEFLADTKSGSIKMEYLSFNKENKLNLKTASGSIKLQLPSDANFKLSANTVSGRIDSEFPLQATKTSSRTLEGIVGTGETESEIRLQSISGSIKVQTV